MTPTIDNKTVFDMASNQEQTQELSWFQRRKRRKEANLSPVIPNRIYDLQLIWLTLLLMAVGFVMVTSASIPIATRLFHEPFHFAIRHFIFLICSLILMVFIVSQPVSRLYQNGATLMMMAVILLIIVLVVGSSVNGARRWIHLGLFNLQPAEIAKLTFFIFLSSYLVRRNIEVRERFAGFIKPIGVFSFIALLLLLQPDFGTVIVMLVTTIGMLFIAGAKLWQFILLIASGSGVVTLLIITQPYRMKRITAFLHPWDDPYGIGYQITQSLMAYGQGHLLGRGLGNSIQKLEYLPEAHTDFVFSILAEEFGFIGVTLVLLLMFALVFKALIIGRQCLRQKMLFEGYLASGFGIWFAFQILVNVGATEGILPAKGLTLPLVSYGGSSLFIMSIAVAILLRIDYERRVAQIQNQHLPQSDWTQTQHQSLTPEAFVPNDKKRFERKEATLQSGSSETEPEIVVIRNKFRGFRKKQSKSNG